MKLIKKNKKAYHDFKIEDEFEAGIVLSGNEVKSLRNHACSIKEAYARINPHTREVWIHNMTIDRYSHSADEEYNPNRKRKLLLHKHQIKRLYKKTEERGYTLVPLALYFNDRNIVKMLLGLGKGKTKYDKRESIKRRDFEREQARSRKNIF
ncbi:MAG: SsrA-binding protein SmpB [candidate division WOR-3 bacterium]|nr:SsrA-binding protein SmpB [candidate division WOR-3 bacterium]